MLINSVPQSEDNEADRQRKSSKRSGNPDHSEPESSDERHRQRASFLIAAYTARDSAFYDGRIDAEVIEACKAAQKAWNLLLKRIQPK
jgi:hypothetical protein